MTEGGGAAPRRRWGREIARWLAIVACAGLAVPALARLTGFEAGPLAFVVALMPWFTLATVVPLALALVARAWVAVAASGTLLALGLAWLLPLALAEDLPDEVAGRYTVASVNVTFGGANADAVVDFVRDNDVDLLAVQELTPECAERLEAAGLTQLLPHADVRPAEGIRGTGVYSRVPLTGGVGVDALFSEAIHTTVQWGDQGITVLAVHPGAPGPVNHDAWDRDMAALGDIIDRVEGPLLVVGDLNTTRDHRAFRDLEAAGLRDAADQAGVGFVPTFPDGRTPVPLVAIDHALVRGAALTATDVRAFSIAGADHRALLVTYAVG